MFGSIRIPRLLSRRNRLETLAERARREHSHWLTCAMADPGRYWRRIPIRRVDKGGFAALTADPAGRAWTERWWRKAIDNAPAPGSRKPPPPEIPRRPQKLPGDPPR